MKKRNILSVAFDYVATFISGTFAGVLGVVMLRVGIYCLHYLLQPWSGAGYYAFGTYDISHGNYKYYNEDPIMRLLKIPLTLVLIMIFFVSFVLVTGFFIERGHRVNPLVVYIGVAVGLIVALTVGYDIIK